MTMTVAKMRHVRARIRELHYVGLKVTPRAPRRLRRHLRPLPRSPHRPVPATAPKTLRCLPKSTSTRIPPTPESIPAPARATVPPPSAPARIPPAPQQQQHTPQYGNGGRTRQHTAPSLRPSYQPGVPMPASHRPTNAQVAMSQQEKPGQQWRRSASPAPPPHSHALLQSGPPALSLAIGGEEGLGINFEAGVMGNEDANGNGIEEAGEEDDEESELPWARLVSLSILYAMTGGCACTIDGEEEEGSKATRRAERTRRRRLEVC
ncbi:hypothetical protein B0H13DRAFT_1876976 [Mycena leptocephala]|nr:hypothetical protein B0H13DRAFT_1876976 [Mycena leptocephala]